MELVINYYADIKFWLEEIKSKSRKPRVAKLCCEAKKMKKKKTWKDEEGEGEIYSR